MIGSARKRPARRSLRLLLCGLAGFAWTGRVLAQRSSGGASTYRSPNAVAYAPDGSILAITDHTWPGLVLVNPADGSVVREIKLLGDPYDAVWNGAGKVLVTEGSNGTLAEVDASSGKVLRRITIGLVAKGVALGPNGRAWVCDRSRNKLLSVDLGTGAVVATIDVGREPGTVAITGNGEYAVVGNKLPRPTNPLIEVPTSEVSIVNLATQEVRQVRLASGTTMIRHVVLSPDSRWAYVTHQSPRGGLPVTQLDNGWVMTNALSIIDIAAGTLYANLVFDHSGSGAAHPWGAAINGDGSRLWVALAGVREVASVNLTALHKRLSGYTSDERLALLRNLTDLHADGTIKRVPLTSVDVGTRGLDLSPDGKTLAVAAYFSGKVLLLSSATLSVSKTVPLPNDPGEDETRRGERYYYSALDCYQQWLSCSSCHDEGRPDSLNWDLSNDGTGNPKQTKSHVYSSETPPTNVSGCRESALVSARAGYQFIEFQAAPEDRVQATYAFLKSLRPEPSPYLGADGKLTPDAVEGKRLFEGDAGCSGCHKGAYFTDMAKHDVGTRRFGSDGPDNNPTWDTAGYDTPSLVEVWRTAPYLHLGSAATVRDVITTENRDLKSHGNVAKLTSQQIDQLVAYVMQIGPTRATNMEVADAGAETPDASGDTSLSPAGSGGVGGDSGEPKSNSSGGTSGTSNGSNSGTSNADSSSSSPSSCVCVLGSRRPRVATFPMGLLVGGALVLGLTVRSRRRRSHRCLSRRSFNFAGRGERKR